MPDSSSIAPFASSRLLQVSPSDTTEITDLASKLMAEGHDIIKLCVGEPDFATPEHIKEAARSALVNDLTRYTAVDGMPDLKRAIQNKFKNANGLDYALDQIIVCNGGKQALNNALLATLSEGDEVLIPAPYWVSYPEMVQLAGGAPVILSCDASHFKLTPDQLDQAINPKTKWLILNSPNNPTGAVYSANELKELGKILLKHPQVYILADDIYEQIIYDSEPFTTLAQAEPRLIERVVTVNGLSKSHSMTGWRVGYAGGPRSIIHLMKTIQSHSTTSVCSISQAAAIAALNGPQDFFAKWIQHYLERRDLVVEVLQETPYLKCKVPAGTFYVFPNCSKTFGKRTNDGALILDDQDFCRELLKSAGVATVPGSAFGHPGHFRISYTVSTKKLMAACQRIHNFCSQLNESAALC